jgi:hypothetical protein
MRRALLLLFAAALLAGCGGDTVSLDPIAQAADKTDDAATARVAIEASIVDPNVGPIKLSGLGVYADHGKAMRLRVTLEPTAITPRHVAELVVIGGTYYVRSALLGDLLPPGKVWLKFTDPDSAFVRGLGQNDPAQFLAFLQATGDVEAVGTERLRGVETTHYKAEVEIDKVLDRASSEQRRRVERLIEEIKSAGIEKIPLEVWIDDDDLVRRMKMDWTLSNGPGETASIKITMDLFDYGAKVTVKAPPGRRVATG